jgi:hypothetical protein
MEDTVIIKELKNYDDLSYNDYGGETIELLFKSKLVDSDVEVYTDYENGQREYITINHEIIYLDTISKN